MPPTAPTTTARASRATRTRADTVRPAAAATVVPPETTCVPRRRAAHRRCPGGLFGALARDPPACVNGGFALGPDSSPEEGSRSAPLRVRPHRRGPNVTLDTLAGCEGVSCALRERPSGTRPANIARRPELVSHFLLASLGERGIPAGAEKSSASRWRPRSEPARPEIARAFSSGTQRIAKLILTESDVTVCYETVIVAEVPGYSYFLNSRKKVMRATTSWRSSPPSACSERRSPHDRASARSRQK